MFRFEVEHDLKFQLERIMHGGYGWFGRMLILWRIYRITRLLKRYAQ